MKLLLAIGTFVANQLLRNVPLQQRPGLPAHSVDSKKIQ